MNSPTSQTSKGAIGIDFGTTNSSIAFADRSGKVQLASFPYFGGHPRHPWFYSEQERGSSVAFIAGSYSSIHCAMNPLRQCYGRWVRPTKTQCLARLQSASNQLLKRTGELWWGRLAAALPHFFLTTRTSTMRIKTIVTAANISLTSI